MQGVEHIAGLLGAIGAPEIIGIGVVILVLFASHYLPELILAWQRKDDEGVERILREYRENIILCLAQGFGVGQIRVAPGTFGSVIGLAWFVALVASGELWIFVGGMVLGLAASIPICGAAERILGAHDPSSVVLDEIAAVPLCFLPWVAIAWGKLGAMPPVAHFFEARAWMITVGIFVLFRVFDALKPWPISKIQNLPGGWGVTADDVLAAIAVALFSLLVVW